MIRDCVRLPMVGDPPPAPIRQVNPKTKTVLRKETQSQFAGAARLPLVGPEGSKNHQKGDSVPSYLTIAFQAHPSMRIC
jgi:hypothetical protein